MDRSCCSRSSPACSAFSLSCSPVSALYGLMSHTVFRRTGERSGLRMAPGALPGHVLRMILRNFITRRSRHPDRHRRAFSAGRIVASMLFDLSPADLLTLWCRRDRAHAHRPAGVGGAGASREPHRSIAALRRIGSSSAANLRFALRQLIKSPGFATVALLFHSLWASARAAMFSIVDAVLLRPLPFADPDRLVWIENEGTSGMSARTTRADTFKAWREENTSLETLAGYFAFFDFGRRQTLTGSGDPERLRDVGVSDNFLDVLGVRLALGRNFTADECLFKAPPVAILSHSLCNAAGLPATRNRRTHVVEQRAPHHRGRAAGGLRLRRHLLAGDRIDLITPFPIARKPHDGATRSSRSAA